jgi:LPXTG-motif cell wall-anchored protein
MEVGTLKKKIGLGVVLGLFLMVTPVLASEKVTSDAEVTFIQKTNANQTIPMEKIEMPEEPSQTSKTSSPHLGFFPRTNEKTSQLLLILGGILLIIVSFLFSRKKRATKRSKLFKKKNDASGR